MVEDKPGSSGNERAFSWWDIQDHNAKLPVKETSQTELRKLLFPSKPAGSHSDPATKAAKGAFKMMGKMAETVVGGDHVDHGPPVSILCFKLLDLVKINDDYNLKHGAHGGQHVPAAPRQPRARPAPAPAPRPPQQVHQPARQQQQAPPRQAPHPARTHSMPHQQQQQQRAPPPQQRQQHQQEASLMDFGDSPAPSNHKVLHHTNSSPASFQPPSNETRTEKLKREYQQKKQSTSRVWDDIDQRWVEVDPKTANSAQGSAPLGGVNASTGMPKKKEVGISLDPANAAGKSAKVQNAVHKRVNDMQEQQQKATEELRQREAKKKQADDAEDVARQQLEPKIKAWAEEHGKRKQLRALLGSLHLILWPGAKWKPLSIGDILDDSKVKRAFHKATLVVHPDKTHHLPPDQRFLAKRIFDAICQAKTEFDEGAK
jgi:hypothetical protein